MSRDSPFGSPLTISRSHQRAGLNLPGTVLQDASAMTMVKWNAINVLCTSLQSAGPRETLL